MGDDLPMDFDSSKYLELNPDVAAAGVNPIAHFLAFGIREGRKYRTDGGVLSRYSTLPPDPNNAFEAFKGAWSTTFPKRGFDTGGSLDADSDPRISWLAENLSLAGLRVLELGPLEAGHTLQLEMQGADVLSIEGNLDAFLRCLIVKNEFQMSSRFLFGDFEKLTLPEKSFDLVMASGVLYHSRNPGKLLRNISSWGKSVFIWTHYFEDDMDMWSQSAREARLGGKWATSTTEEVIDGERFRSVRQEYGQALGFKGFCGGTASQSNWPYREDIIHLLNKLGFNDLNLGFDQPDHPNGPSFAILARNENS